MTKYKFQSVKVEIHPKIDKNMNHTMAAMHLWLPMKYFIIKLTVINVHCKNDYLIYKNYYVDIHLFIEQFRPKLSQIASIIYAEVANMRLSMMAECCPKIH